MLPAVAVLLTATCSRADSLRIAVVGSDFSTAGADLAVADINSAGGIRGRLLELTIVREPSAASPGDAIATAQQLSEDKAILAVVGHGGSSRSLAASQVYNERRLLHVAPNSSAPLFSRTGAFSYRLVASDEHQVRFIAELVSRMTPRPRVALVYSNDDYGRPLHDGLTKALGDSGIAVVYDTPFIDGMSYAQGVGGLVDALAAAKPDLLLWIGRSSELTLTRDLLMTQSPRLQLIGTDAVGQYGPALGALLNGDMVVSHVDMKSQDPRFIAAATRFRARTGRPMNGIAALSYDAVGVIASALRAGATTREQVREHLERSVGSGNPYVGITGPITFNANGDAMPRYVLLEARGDSLRRVLP